MRVAFVVQFLPVNTQILKANCMLPAQLCVPDALTLCGTCDVLLLKISDPWSWASEDIVDGLNAFLGASQQPNLVPYAPGGGTENVGVAAAVNDMLVQSYRDNTGRYLLHLFPVWPSEAVASFRQLLCKGGFVVSASWTVGSCRTSVCTTVHLLLVPHPVVCHAP